MSKAYVRFYVSFGSGGVLERTSVNALMSRISWVGLYDWKMPAYSICSSRLFPSETGSMTDLSEKEK